MSFENQTVAGGNGDEVEHRWSVAYPLDDLWEGDMEGVEVVGHKVLLVNVEGEIRAYRNRCPHQGWPLSEGDFDGATIVCANHSWEFDAKSGCGVNPADCALSRYPCMVNNDGMICVDVT